MRWLFQSLGALFGTRKSGGAGTESAQAGTRDVTLRVPGMY